MYLRALAGRPGLELPGSAYAHPGSHPNWGHAASGDLLGASTTNAEAKKALVHAAGLGRPPVMRICLLGPWAAKPLGLSTTNELLYVLGSQATGTQHHKRALVCSGKPPWPGQALHRGHGVVHQSISVMLPTPVTRRHQK